MKIHLPGILGYIADRLGEEVAVAFGQARGGREFYIPANPSPDHELSKIVGHEAAIEIAKLLGAGSVMVPKGNLRMIKMLNLRDQGLSHAQIACELDCHVHTVSRVLAEQRDPRQNYFDFD